MGNGNGNGEGKGNCNGIGESTGNGKGNGEGGWGNGNGGGNGKGEVGGGSLLPLLCAPYVEENEASQRGVRYYVGMPKSVAVNGGNAVWSSSHIGLTLRPLTRRHLLVLAHKEDRLQ